ncbi:MAG: diguanylate cyclase [Desulfovibrionaceae bacterium]|nr:diguanylate cyclase [Desulfovibrionaceae bacterium]
MKLVWKLAFPQICIVVFLGLISFIVINASFVTMRERYIGDFFEDHFERTFRDMDRRAWASVAQASVFARLPVVVWAYEIALSGNINDEYSPQSQAARELLRKELAPMLDSYREATGQTLQLHFHLPNGFSLARLWREKNTRRNGEWVDISDDISSYRPTVMHVNATGETVIGLEPGSGGFAIRGVIPVKAPDGRQLGSVEVLQDFDAILSAATKAERMSFALYADKALLRFSVALQDSENHPRIGDFVRVFQIQDRALEGLITPELLSRGKSGDTIARHGTVVLMARPLADYSGNQVGVMVCAMHIEAVSEFARTAGITLALMLAGMAVVPFITLLLYSRRLISRPVNTIKAIIQDIAEDRADLSRQVPSHQNDEIGELAGWFNVLTAKVGDIMEEMSEIIDKNIEIKIQLAKEKEFFQTTVNSIGDAVITVGVNGVVITMNDAAEAITGHEKKHAAGKHFSYAFSLLHEKDRTPFEYPLEEHLAEGITVTSEAYLLLADDGTEKHISLNCSPIRGEDGIAMGAVLVFRDISEAKAQAKKMEYLSYHDSLTSLHNRAFFEHVCDTMQQERIAPVAIIMGDANGLKQANDVHGHSAGDMLLRAIAHAFKSACRSNDVVVRWGGDEFLAVLPGLTHERAHAIMNNIHAHCARARIEPLKASVSLGLAIKESPETPFIEVLKVAEERMYQAKQEYNQAARQNDG